MKTQLLFALLTLSPAAVLAQDVDMDVDGDTSAEVQIPGMKVKVKVSGGAQPLDEAPPPPNQGPRGRGPQAPPVRVMGVDTFDIRFEMKPQESLRLLSPEGAHAEIWGDDGSYLGGFDLPCEVPARPGMYYRVVMTANGALLFDRKVELRKFNRTNVTFRGGATTVVVVNQPAPSFQQLDFPALVAAVKAETFGEAKLDVLRTSEGGLTVDQVGQLVDLFTFSSEQVAVVEITHRRIVDRQNAFKLSGHFTFEGDKKKVKAILGK